MHDLYFWYEPAPAVEPAPNFGPGDIAAAFGVDEARHLGTGAFGETWAVEGGAETTALKIIHDDSFPARRLEREVEGLRRSDSEHVVSLLETGVTEIGGMARPFLQFEFIEGGDVAAVIAEAEWPNHDEAEAFARGMLEGLSSLHANESAHRDLKPANVALRDGRWDSPVILDLGLVKLLDEDSLTRYPALMGTAAFMAPEQVRRERARKAADMWALGVILHLLLARQHPFYRGYGDRVETDEALRLMRRGAPPLPDAVPGQLRELVARSLSFKQYARGSADRALRDLEGGSS